MCEAVQEHQPQVIQLLRLMLPALAKALQKRKGDIFGYREHDESLQHSLSKMDSEELDNVDAEKSA